MTGEARPKRPTRDEIFGSLWGDPIFNENNPKGIVDLRNKPVKPRKAEASDTEQTH